MTLFRRLPRLANLVNLTGFAWLGIAVSAVTGIRAGAEEFASHPPLRPIEYSSDRPRTDGPSYFVDPAAGDNAQTGSEAEPWRTIQHAAAFLKPGDTLYLRGGLYYENVTIALKGSADRPITIRGFPGENAIIDGSWREFSESPSTAWEPVPESAFGEYRSTKAYPNQRDVLGSFGDSLIGLQTYYHAEDLRAESEVVDWIDWEHQKESDIKPLYLGPGLWHDPVTGRIHLRLSHTRLPDPVPNYRGETDPRRLPLLLAPFRSTPLTVDSGEHLRFQDLTIRGAGYTSVVLDQAVNVEFDHVTVWCGTYGMRVSGTRQLKIVNSSLYGNVAPWTFRADGSKRDYPDRAWRNLSRLNTHALLEIETGGESSVYATPQNDDWEISHSEFTDAHDGVYLGAINCRFHHNLIENLQDDGLYLSPMYLRHRLDQSDPRIEIYQNVFRGVLTALAFGGSETATSDQFFIYRNVFDLRHPVQTGRPSTQKTEATFSFGKPMGDHGSPPWPAMNLYHNTFVVLEPQRDVTMTTTLSTKSGHPRRVFNNLYLHLDRFPAYPGPNPAENAIEDGNLFWSAGGKATSAEKLFAKFRSSEAFAASQAIHPPGSSTHSIVADPKLGEKHELTAGSGAIDSGIPIPEDWPDPVRAPDKGKPDIGAIPFGVLPEPVGRSKQDHH